jgi:ABC-2 type transport system permease protein
MEFIDIYPVKRVIKREWRRISTTWPFLFVTFVGPLFVFFLVTWIFSSDVPRDLPVAAVDMDHTATSRQLVRMTDATSIASVNRSFLSLEDAHNAMDKGLLDAILYIPKGTEADIINGQSAHVAFYINNSNVVKGGLLNSGVRKALATYSAGVKMRMQYRKGLNDKQAMAKVMPVQLKSILLFNPYISYSYYLTAGLLPVMLIVFTLLGTIYSLGTELLRGTGPHWLHIADDNMGYALFGKLFPFTIIYFIVALFMNFLLFGRMGMPLQGNYLLLIFSELLLIICYQFLALFLVSVTGNLRLSLSLGSGYSMLALTYSGLTFPAIGMPLLGQIITYIFPYTFWLKILMGQSLRGEPVSNILAPMLALVAFMVLGMAFIPKLKYMLKNKEEWGKQ